MIRKIILATALIAGGASSAVALEIPRGASQDSRVRFVNYQPFNITRIVGTLRSSVQVEFAADEEIAHVALGNSVAWEVAPAGNILFLKPRENQPVTNISVVTTRRDGSTRSYQMELTVRDGSVAVGQNTYFYVKFRYPRDEAEQRQRQAAARALANQAKEADNVLALHEAYGPRNWRYSAQGAQALEPQSVSPMPKEIPDIRVLQLLLDREVIVICTGGGGIPVLRQRDGCMTGIEAVIDKDAASALLAQQLGADALLLLTDVDAVYRDFGTRTEAAIATLTPDEARTLDLPAGSMGPKIVAAANFADQGGLAGIGRLDRAVEILERRAGTRVVSPRM